MNKSIVETIEFVESIATLKRLVYNLIKINENNQEQINNLNTICKLQEQQIIILQSKVEKLEAKN